ncbi:MAG TPA: hypothetical protein VFJ16_24400 [Longimicrobium sp.]|nr:hypothetical protein [Longimicrobium sp.]
MTAPVLAACAALLLRATAPESGFCSCAGPMTDAEAVRHSAVVFEGRVTRSRQVRRGDGISRRVYTFTVTHWRKGAPRRTVQVETGLGGGDCGVTFPRRRTVMVYASEGPGGRLGTGICSGPYLPVPDPPPPPSGRDR